MSSRQPIKTGSTGITVSTTGRTAHGRSGVRAALCRTDGRIPASASVPDAQIFLLPERRTHVCARVRKERTIFRMPTGGSLPAEDRAALFRRDARQHKLPHAAPSPLRRGPADGSGALPRSGVGSAHAQACLPFPTPSKTFFTQES